MKYKVGDKVRIKSLDWYNENKNEYGNVEFSTHVFVPRMSKYCGMIVTIEDVFEDTDGNVAYYVDGIDWDWTDEMIEGLVEEEIKSEPKFHISDWATDGDVLAEDSCIFIIQKLGDNSTAAKTYCTLYDDGDFDNGTILYFDIDSTRPATKEEKQKLFKAIKDNGYKWNPETKTLEKLIEPKFREYSDNEPLDISTMTTDFVKEHGLPCPEGYIFKDENGNVINATKIVLEKKKKEYPKTFDKCCHIVQTAFVCDVRLHKGKYYDIFRALAKLIVCRDAYWKIAGEEMGLGKPWKPDYGSGVDKFGIICLNGVVQESNPTTNWERHLNKILDFPTPEMRDAFKENFDPDIEFCKEFL